MAGIVACSSVRLRAGVVRLMLAWLSPKSPMKRCIDYVLEHYTVVFAAAPYFDFAVRRSALLCFQIVQDLLGNTGMGRRMNGVDRL